MDEKILLAISKKLNVLIALKFKELSGDKELNSKDKRNFGIGEKASFLASMGLDSKDIAEILNSPLPSIRTLLTPKRRK